MEAEDPLSELADIHLPDAVSFWPPAPGWWLVAALVLCGLVWLCRHMLVRMHKQRKLQRAVQELERIYQQWQVAAQNADGRNKAGLDLLYGFNATLKRAALATFPETEVARLTGQPWLQFLDRVAGGNAFTAGAGQVLGDGMYRPVHNADIDALLALCKRWIMQGYLKPLNDNKTAMKATTTTAGNNTQDGARA